MQLAISSLIAELKARISLPTRVPRFNTAVYRIFTFIWVAAFLLAVVGPAMGLYVRYTAPENNSQLLLGSRAGIAVSEHDATKVRFAVGPYARAAGIRAGDDIVAIYGMPLPEVLPVTREALLRNADDPSYITISNLLFGSDNSEMPLTLRSPDGAEREVLVRTGEHHIEAAAREWGISPALLSFVDLVHVIFYPFLLWAAWILHRRNSRDAVSSVLSLAILLTIGTEQPSATFLAVEGVPRAAHVFLYDLGNVCLLAGILLFPHGALSPRRILLLVLLPSLMLLQGDLYRTVFVIFMILAVLILLRSHRKTPAGDLRQQIKWALFGFSGYALFRALSLAGDMLKTSTESFATQFGVEILAGLFLGLAFLSLQLGLLIALLRYRLYDAEAIISRTASIAIVTIALGGVFAGVMEGIITQMQEIYPDSQTPAAMIGAVVATMLIGPLHGRVQSWAERRFHKNLLELREGLPEAMRDLRDVASLTDFLQEVLSRVNAGVLASRSALVLGREVVDSTGVGKAEVLRWLLAFQPRNADDRVEHDQMDPLFPLRVRVEDGSGTDLGWLLVGPRPDGSVAGGDEREALGKIAVPLARSLRIVLNRQEEKKELLQLLEAHRQRIERIERWMQAP